MMYLGIVYFHTHKCNSIHARYKTTAFRAAIVTEFINTQQCHVQTLLYGISLQSNYK